MLEVPGSTTILGEDGCSVAVLVIVNYLDSFLQAIDVHDAHAGSKNFLDIARHIGFHMVENSRPDPQAVRLPFNLCRSSIEEQLGAFLLHSTDDLVDLIVEVLVAHWRDVGLCLKTRAQFEGLRLCN